jgi:hypothetical protein
VLPELETGEAIVWSPAWLKFAGKVHVLPKVTFDSSKTPEAATRGEPKVLAPVEVEQLRLAMAAAVAEVEAKDPAALKKRIRQLEVELASRPPPAPPVRVEVSAVQPDELAVLKGLGNHLLTASLALIEVEKRLGHHGPGTEPRQVKVPAVAGPPPGRPPAAGGKAPKLEGTGLKKGAREMLRELAGLHPKSLTRRELATRVVMAHAGGSTGDYISALRAAGFIEDDENGDYRATPDGLSAAGAVRPKSSGEIVALWKGTSKFKRGARDMLDAVIETGAAMNREQLAEVAGMEASGGSTGDYISALVSSGCVDKVGKGYAPGHALFLGER